MMIGQRIETLQSEMSYREYLTWCAYRNKYGPVNPVRMYDQGSGIVAATLNNAHGGKAKPVDFMPYDPRHKVNDIEDVDAQEFTSLLRKSGAKIGR